MMTPRRLLAALLLTLGTLQMTSPKATEAPRPAAPMTGPDFVMEHITSWTETAGAASQLVLADGSRWHISPGRRDYAVQVTFVELARRSGEELLVSGSLASGEIDRLDVANKLAVQRVGEREVDGRTTVVFHGPPSIFHVRMSRPGAARDLALLRHSAASKAFMDNPDLLVGIDMVAKEVVAVRSLPTASLPPGSADSGPSR